MNSQSQLNGKDCFKKERLQQKSDEKAVVQQFSKLVLYFNSRRTITIKETVDITTESCSSN